MKLFSLTIIALFLLGSLALAEAPTDTIINENCDRDDVLGLGVDVEYDINDVLGSAIEVRRDLENDEWSLFLVGKVKLNSLLEKPSE